MPLLTCEFQDGDVREWHATNQGVEQRWTRDYRPTIYVDGPREALEDLQYALRDDPKVASTGFERWFTDLGEKKRSLVLAISLDRFDEVRTLAHEIRHHYEDEIFYPATFRLYNVDLAPQFRFCVETETSPVPARDLDVVRLALLETALRDGDVTALTLDGEALGEVPSAVLTTLHDRLEHRDPDVLCCSTARIIPLCHKQAQEVGIGEFRLGRAGGYSKLAGASTYESYGQVGHSPARFRVPGRAVVDESNSFLLDESGISGLLDLVERSWRPLQETAWGSIGTILTAIQVREALSRGVLIPWNKWEPEAFKSVATLHDADRGGFTFAPEVGIHEDVVQVDFGSLYPNIMVEHNISPETVCCECHDREDVPGIGYSICDRAGFIPDVLEPIISDRAAIKDQITAAEDTERETNLQAKSDALKWILVSCFGYQGYKNAKFGRIECHESINAFAREILLDAKETLETGGWRVVHGIVDSLWVQPVEDETQTPIPELCDRISAEASIPLELEDRLDWVCFVPLADSEAGALTKYFGKIAGEDEIVTKGIEAVQRSTPTYIEELQRELIWTLDRERTPEAVAERLHRGIQTLVQGRVDPSNLLIRKRVSKSVDEYDQRTQTVAALQRAADQELPRHAGQDVEYLVVDDSRRSKERVQLAHESLREYDADFYRELALRAGESIMRPLGWDRSDYQRYTSGTTELSLEGFQ
ncbi:type B DNA-directed DNA polymerase [Salinibaculum salinum]|uniref:type B DNA-directed DNA polymerase n=1 Tax=Salinibaculum salinum TaxID=3131996 RepID=UPI0030ECCB6D